MKMMAGAAVLACSKRSRTRLAPTPTIISMNSDADSEKNGTSASPATARASRVLPVPGGPDSSTPLGMVAPRRRYCSGFFRKSTISTSSSSTSSMPATSSKVARLVGLGVVALRLGPADPADAAHAAAPGARDMKNSRPMNSSVGPKPISSRSRNDGPGGDLALTTTPLSASS